MGKIYPNGISTEITVAAAGSIAVFTQGTATVYQMVGYPNFPTTKELVGTVSNGESVYGPYASGATIVIEAGASEVFYETATTPSIATKIPSGLRVDRSQAKFFNRAAGTVDAFAVQVKSEPCNTTDLHAMIEGTCDWEPTTAAQAGSGVRAVQGVARLQASKTVAGGSIAGVYGQVCNNGTIDGSGVMASALYGLIEEGAGTYTALSHLACAWLDSHLNDAVSAGSKDMVYISNNGATTFDDVFYIYGGNKITNLFKLDTVGGMVANAAGTTAGANPVTIKLTVDGVTKYILAADGWS